MKIEKIDGTLLPYTIQGPYRTPCFEGPTKTGIRNWSGVALGRFFATKPSLIGSRRWVGGDGKRQKARITEYRKWPGKKRKGKKKKKKAGAGAHNPAAHAKLLQPPSSWGELESKSRRGRKVHMGRWWSCSGAGVGKVSRPRFDTVQGALRIGIKIIDSVSCAVVIATVYAGDPELCEG